MEDLKLFRIFTFLAFGVLSAGSALAVEYIAKKGDSLSKIASLISEKPIYGKRGSLNKLILLNPKIKNADLIFAGQKIHIGPSSTTSDTNRAPSNSADKIIDNTFQNTGTVQNKSTPPEFQPYSIFSGQPSFSFFSIDSKDISSGDTATILSNLNIGFDLFWKQVWTKNWQSKIGFGYSKIDVSDPVPVKFSSSSLSTVDFSFGMTYSPIQNLFFSASMGLEQKLFFRSIDTSTVTLDRVFIPYSSIAVGYTFVKLAQFSLSTEGGASFLFPSQNNYYHVGSGMGSFGRLYLQQDLSKINSDLQASIFFRRQSQNTTLTEQARTDVGMIFGLNWRFGGP